MEVISFDKLYNSEFFISEVLAKPQYWAVRGNVYNAIGRPKISHTLLWFKNCSATIRDSLGNVLQVKKNQLTYMAKGLEYVVHFHDTDPNREDTVVIHFQMTDRLGRDISACGQPMVCVSDVSPALAVSIQALVQECKNNMVCTPALLDELYKILALICQKQKSASRKTVSPVSGQVFKCWKRTAICLFLPLPMPAVSANVTFGGSFRNIAVKVLCVSGRECGSKGRNSYFFLTSDILYRRLHRNLVFPMYIISAKPSKNFAVNRLPSFWHHPARQTMFNRISYTAIKSPPVWWRLFLSGTVPPLCELCRISLWNFFQKVQIIILEVRAKLWLRWKIHQQTLRT